MTIEEKRRELFEQAVIERMKQSGFLEVEIRVECLTRLDDDYLDSSVDAYWHFWNAAFDAVVIELPKLWISNESGASEQAACQTLNACKQAIESTGLGLKVKS